MSFGGGIAPVVLRDSPRKSGAGMAVRGGVTIDLDDAVHSSRAAAGDVIHGHLAKAVEGAAAGSEVEGRLMRVEMRHGARPLVTISLRWDTVLVNGARVPLDLTPKRTIADLAKDTGKRLGRIEIEPPPVGDGRYGVYRFSAAQAVMESGYRTEWITARR